MKLHSIAARQEHVVAGYGPGWIDVGGRRFERSLLLRPGIIDPDWGPAPGEALAAAHLTALAGLAGTVVLLGTGLRQRFPETAWLRPLREAGIGIEIMDTGAACRTYNILVAEGRDVAAALVIE